LFEKNKKTRRKEETQQVHISETLGMGDDDVGQHFHHKNQLVSLKCYGATYV